MIARPQWNAGTRLAALAGEIVRVRAFTEKLCESLEPDDYVVQSMPDASPAKWHLAHTTWFFERFVLGVYMPGFRPYDCRWGPLFNSYYEAFGPRHPRHERGLLTRPTVLEVYKYRAAIDEQLQELLKKPVTSECAALANFVDLGLQHEQQHQELLLTDLQHAFSRNPLCVKYRTDAIPPQAIDAPAPHWLGHEGGLVTAGHAGEGFAFDNETPAHRVYLEPFEIASHLVTCAEYAEFIASGGYERSQWWLSDGWTAMRTNGWQAPLYWELIDGTWHRFSLYGLIPVVPTAPVSHVSFYEADAFARWSGDRLATETEWETLAKASDFEGQFVEDGVLVPLTTSANEAFFGRVWVWTASPYVPYPGYRAPVGAIGEYNGKFMCNQMVLRGGSCFSPRTHVRATYRNFFPPHARWQVTGIRLARGG